jgi:hypothetical protein
VSSSTHGGAPRAVDVLPSRASRRLTRRDGVLPLVLAMELLAGVAFGVAGSSGSSAAASAPAELRFAPVASVTFIGPMAPPPVGPPVGPLIPGQVRAPMPVSAVAVAPAAPAAPVAPADPAPRPRRHAPRNPFAVLIKGETTPVPGPVATDAATAAGTPDPTTPDGATTYNTLPKNAFVRSS